MPENPGARNPTWSRDELILTLDLYVQFKGNPPGKTSKEVTELSDLLNMMGDLPSQCLKERPSVHHQEIEGDNRRESKDHGEYTERPKNVLQ